jgi:hypothetical protein
MKNSSEQDVETVLREAEQIRAGENPATVSADTASPIPASSAGGGGEEGTVATGAAPSPSFEQLADLACLLCDWPFVRSFGPSAQLAEPFRTEAKKAWLAVMEKYLPAVMGQGGPLGVLLTIYGMHGAGLYLAWQINAPVAASSAKEAQGNPP